MTHSSEKTNNYFECKSEWENLERIKTEGAILRSKVKWAEEGEKNTKYFLNLEKKNYQVKYIKKLIKDNGTELPNPRDILQEQKQFYSSLYSSKLDSFKYSSDNFLPIEKIPTLNDFDKQLCEDNLQIEDIARALRELPNDKTPGSDGFTTNFYKFFWPDIKNLLFNSFKFSFDNGELSNDQKRGILNLIPK